MKIMRYRIRVITLVLIAALLAVLLLVMRAAWFPADNSEASPETSPGNTLESPETDETLAPEADATSTPEPLFDTNGL